MLNDIVIGSSVVVAVAFLGCSLWMVWRLVVCYACYLFVLACLVIVVLGLVFAVWVILLVRVVFCVDDCGIVLRWCGIIVVA